MAFKVNDINKDLITTFNVIKENHEQLIYGLNRLKITYSEHPQQEELYYTLRNEYNNIINEINTDADVCYDTLCRLELIDYENDLVPTSKHPNLLIALLFIFLNKTCFRGLYRVNKHNQFNVPFGHYKNPSFINESEIIELNKLFQHVEFHNEDYITFIENNLGDDNVIYLDPPYYGTFNDYSSLNFDHGGLVEECQKLATIGKIIISNSDSFYDKYKNDLTMYQLSTFTINDKINSKSPNSTRNEIILNN